MEIIRLTAPEQHEATNSKVELDARAVKNWVNELPLNDAATTVRELQTAISALNEIVLPTAKRLKLLEIYHGLMQRLLHYYDELRLQQISLAKPDRATLVSEIVWLFQSLSQGYNIIIKSVYGNDNHSESTDHILRATFCSLQALSYSYIFATKFSVEIPHLVFLEAHQLYRFSEKYFVNDIKVKGIKGNSQTPTIGGIYKQFLLTAISISIGLDSKKALEMYDSLEQFSNKSQVRDRHDDITNRVSFIIDLFDDKPPHLMNPDVVLPDGDDHRYLDIEPTISFIMAWMDSFAHTKMAEDFKREIYLLEKFIDLINSATATLEPNIVENCRVRILSELRYQRKPQLRRGSGENASALNYYEDRANSETDSATDDQQQYSLYNSNSGAKLISPTAMAGDIDSGEIVFISQDADGENEASSLVAYVNEVTNNDQETEFQLDILSQRAVAISYIKENSVSVGNPRHYGLYLPVDDKYNLHASLLIDKKDFSPQHRFQVKLNNQMFIVKPKETLKDTESFVQFRFSAVKVDNLNKRAS